MVRINAVSFPFLMSDLVLRATFFLLFGLYLNTLNQPLCHSKPLCKKIQRRARSWKPFAKIKTGSTFALFFFRLHPSHSVDLRLSKGGKNHRYYQRGVFNRLSSSRACAPVVRTHTHLFRPPTVFNGQGRKKGKKFSKHFSFAFL